MDLIRVVTELLVLLTVIADIAFVILYQVLFDPSRTTAGRLIRRVMLSLGALGGLSVARSFFDEAPDWFAWAQLAVWLFVAYAFTSMVWLILVRRFRPERLHTRPIEDTLQPRTSLPPIRHRKRK